MARINHVFALVGLGIVLMAGPAAAQGIQGGVQGGVTFSGLSNLRNAIDFGGPVDIERRTGVVVGPFVAFPLNNLVAIQVEALYVTKGATPTDGVNRVNIELAYVDVPVLLRFAPWSKQRFYFLLGPSMNFNVSAKAIEVMPTRAEEDVKDDIRTSEFGAVAGAGVTLGNFLIEGRYSAGFTDIADTQQITEAVRNRAFAILLGVRF